MNIQSAQYQKDPLDSAENAGIILLIHGDSTKYYVPYTVKEYLENDFIKEILTLK